LPINGKRAAVEFSRQDLGARLKALFFASILPHKNVPAAAPAAGTRDTPERKRMSEHIVHVTDQTFEPEVLRSDLPVLVDYWAEWCGPCKAIAPILDEIAREYGGKLKVAKLDVDANVEVPKKYNIRGIPTLMLFKNGNVEESIVGARSKSQLTAFLDSNI
jgi:thioredoxin 1